MNGTNEARASAAATPPKGGEGNDEKIQRGRGERGRCIVLMQRKFGKVGKLVNLVRLTIWIHRAVLVKSGRVQNLGGVM